MEKKPSKTDADERALIKRAREGEERARNALIERYFSVAERACLHHGRKKGVDRDDAQSEIFFTITDAINGYDLRHTRTSFEAYIWQRARGSITWVDREQRKQDLRKLSAVWTKTFGGVGKPGKGYMPPKPPVIPKHKQEDILIGKCFRVLPNDQFRKWLRACPRRNDRMIATWLWWRISPLSQAEVARKLKISRSAVCQRRIILFEEVFGAAKKDVSKQMLESIVLNNYRRSSYSLL